MFPGVFGGAEGAAGGAELLVVAGPAGAGGAPYCATARVGSRKAVNVVKIIASEYACREK